MTSDQDKVEYGWLIEHEDEPKWLTGRPDGAAYEPCWTKESEEALRFCRRQDAEDFVTIYFGGEGPICITEHAWDIPRTRALEASQPQDAGWSYSSALPEYDGGLKPVGYRCLIVSKIGTDVLCRTDRWPTMDEAYAHAHRILAALTPPIQAAESGLPDELRREGWMVAVHNDYRLNGEFCTFWLFAHPDGRWIKGEGRSDAEAIYAALLAKAGKPQP